MSELRRNLRKVLGAVVSLGLLASCESSSTTVSTNPESRLRLSPQELTPVAGCQHSSGDATDMSGYVVTLVDVTADEKDRVNPKVVLSGPATTCTSSITFAVSADRGDLEVGNSYAAIVDGYTGSSLSAVKGNLRAQKSEGSPTSPSWQWLCSFGALPEDALSDLLNLVREVPRQTPAAGGSADAGTSSSGTEYDASMNQAGSSDAGDSGPIDSGDGLMSDASPLDAAPDAAPEPAAEADATVVDAAAPSVTVDAGTGTQTSLAPVALDSGLLELNGLDASASGDAGMSSQTTGDTSQTTAANSTSSAVSSEMALMSALEELIRISKESSTPAPATLAQSRLGTLRGCVVLP